MLQVNRNADSTLPQTAENENIGTKTKENGKFYSIYDKVAGFGVISVEEQQTAFMEQIDDNFKNLCATLGYEITELLSKCISRFKEIVTDGSEKSAKIADLEVEINCAKTNMDILDKIDKLEEAKEQKKLEEQRANAEQYEKDYAKAMNNLEQLNTSTLNSLHGKTKEEQCSIIKEQYPYYTDEDVEARYEIQNMQYKSADIIEALHSGKRPAEVLKEYKESLETRKRQTITEHFAEEDDMAAYTTTKQYDDKGRIVEYLREVEGYSPEKYVYEYKNDGSYIITKTDEDSIVQEYWNSDGKRVFDTVYSTKHNLRTDFELYGEDDRFVNDIK